MRRRMLCGSCWRRRLADGGWSDLDSMESSAYATGKALVALRTAGLSVSDAAYERAVRFLLKTQQEDGSWYVRTRAMAFQPFKLIAWAHRREPPAVAACRLRRGSSCSGVLA
jgi:Prenyltransferase and squalene oxidase repeat